jgi:redox-sensitive bicupin YhaK (pirin superfamily)
MCIRDSLDPGSEFDQPIPAGHTVIAYVYDGIGHFGVNSDKSGEPVEAVHMIEFGDGDLIHAATSPESSVSFMLIAGMPFQEPIVPYGPFVMNTVEEIQQTLLDLRNGTFVQA